jgi:Glycosyltransferase family 87
MKFARPDLSSLVLIVSALLFLFLGSRNALHHSIDFVPAYTGARCLIHGCNPYNTSQLTQQYFQAGGRIDELPGWEHETPVYPPSTLLAISPLALLPYQAARALWFLLNGSLFAISAGLILSLCPRPQRWMATALVSLILASSGILLELGQPSLFAISLLIIGSCLFLRDRFLPLGAVLLMLSLAVKPQLGGLIVLYLLVRGIHRRYAVAAMAGALALLLCAGLILRMNPSSANWTSDLSANLSARLTGNAGDMNDPRPANKQAVCDINLQAITGIFFSNAREFNDAAWAVFLILLVAGGVVILRAKAGPEMNLISLGALAALSLTPVYHRFYDTRMLLITVPAVVIVYQKRRLLGAVIGALTVLALISVQSRLQAYFDVHPIWQSILQNKILFILILRQQNLELPIIFCLYIVAIFSMRFPSAPAKATAAPAH